MAASTPSSILEPEQQQAGTGVALIQSASSPSSSVSAWNSSGSVGPFFAVISVLAILAFLSCYFGRRLNGRAPTPLESITGRGCFGWLRRMFSRCCRCNDDVEVGGVGAKVMACNNKDSNNECKVEE